MSNYTSKGYTTPTGVNSREDVRQWQQRLGVTADGIWGKNTQAAYRKWRLSGGTGSASAAGAATGASLSGGTAQQKNTASTTDGWWERMGNAVSKLTGGKTAADPLPTPKRNYAVMSVNGIGVQYASGKAKAKQNTAPKKEVPKPQYEWDMYGLGVDGIGGQMHADEIAAAEEDRKQRQQQYISNPNPYEGKNSNYGTFWGWQESMPVDQTPALPYTGGMGGYQEELMETLEDAPNVNVLLDKSQLTAERIAEAEREQTPYQYKLADEAYETEGTRAYRRMEYEMMEAIAQLPADARIPGQGSDFAQPAVEYLEGRIAELEQELRFWLNREARGNPVLTKDAPMMIESIRKDLKKNRELLSKMIYILPDEFHRNEFGAEYAPLLATRTMDKETTEQLKIAIHDLQDIRLACYIEGDYGRSAAAADILNILERKLAGIAAFTGGANNFALGIPDYLLSREYAEQETDYDRFLHYMYSADAIQAANPNAYQAGEFAVTAAQGIKSVIGLGKEAIKHLGGKALSEAGKEFWIAMGKTIAEDAVKSELTDAFEAELRKQIQQNYEHPKG